MFLNVSYCVNNAGRNLGIQVNHMCRLQRSYAYSHVCRGSFYQGLSLVLLARALV